MIPRISGYSPIFIIASLLLAGCSETSTSSREINTSTYLFYSSYDSSTGQFGLTAVDPDAPASPITIGTTSSLNKAIPRYYLAGNVSGPNINDLHYRYMVYGTGTGAATGNLYRLGARKEDGLGAIQISNEAAAFDICPDGGMMGPFYNNFTSPLNNTGITAAYPDYVNPLNSVYIYQKDGGGTCASSSTTAVPNVVRLNHDSSTAPFTTTSNLAQYPVAPVYNSTGSLNSLIFWSANSQILTRRNIDATLTQAGLNLATGVIEKPSMLNIGPGGEILLSIKKTGSIYSLHIYNPATQTLSTDLTNGANSVVYTAASDDSAFYYHIGNTIYRAPHSATSAAGVATVTTDTLDSPDAVIYAGALFSISRDIVISNGRLVYSLINTVSGNVYIRSISASASGGSSSTLYSYNSPSVVPPDRLFAASGRIYLTLLDPMNAVSIPDGGGTPLVFANSRWLGFTYQPTTRLFGDLDRPGGNMRAKSMFRAAYDPVDPTVVTGLYSYDASTTALLVNFGATAPGFSTYLMTFVPDMLGIATQERTLFAFNNNNNTTCPSASQPCQDIVYLHARDGSSARQITYNDTTPKQLIGMNNGGCTLGDGNKFDPLLLLLAALSLIHLGRRWWREQLSTDAAKRRGRFGTAVLGLTAFFIPGAQADDLILVPGAGLGQSSMDFTRSTSENDQATFNVVEISLTAAYKGVYLRGSTELPLGEAYSHGPALIRQFKREDASLTLGWHPFETFPLSSDKLAFLKSLSIFGGYSSGKTSVMTYDGGSGLPPYAVYTEYLDEGMYYGLGYSLRVGDIGSLSLNVAQASMDGSFLVQPSDLGGVTTTETGTTQGLSYGLTWGGSFRDKATYYLSWRQRSYTTDLVTISIDKQFRILSAGFIFPL